MSAGHERTRSGHNCGHETRRFWALNKGQMSGHLADNPVIYDTKTTYDVSQYFRVPLVSGHPQFGRNTGPTASRHSLNRSRYNRESGIPLLLRFDS